MTSAEVANCADISFRMLDWWVRTGRIPGVKHLVTPGSGYPRQWTVQEAMYVATLARIVKAGVRLDVAAKALADEVARGTAVADIRAVSLPGGASLNLRPALQAVSA
jgi:hypothetical protein